MYFSKLTYFICKKQILKGWGKLEKKKKKEREKRRIYFFVPLYKKLFAGIELVSLRKQKITLTIPALIIIVNKLLRDIYIKSQICITCTNNLVYIEKGMKNFRLGNHPPPSPYTRFAHVWTIKYLHHVILPFYPSF